MGGVGNAKAPVAQLDRALPSEGRGQRFESSRARQFPVSRIKMGKWIFLRDYTICRRIHSAGSVSQAWSNPQEGAMRTIGRPSTKGLSVLSAAALMLIVTACGTKQSSPPGVCPLVGTRSSDVYHWKRCYYDCNGKTEILSRDYWSTCPNRYPSTEKGRRVLSCYENENELQKQSCLKKIEHLFR